MRKILLTVFLALFAIPLFAKDVVVNSDDAMKFDVSEIKVKAGEEIKLTLNHTGKLGKDVMGHNFVVLAQGTDIQAFSNSAIQAKANDYIPEGNESVLAHTKVIGGGESDTITFTLKEKGTYEFICSFPGHSFMMKGVIIVE